MSTRKTTPPRMATQRPPAPALKPAFVVADVEHTDFIGLTKRECFAAITCMGIYAGPAGRVVLDSTDDAMFERVREVCFRQADVMLAGSNGQ